MRNKLSSHVVACGRVTKEGGDIDEDLVEEDRELFGMDLQIVLVRGKGAQAKLGAALADAPHDRVSLVPAVVEAAVLAQVLEQHLELLAGLQSQSRSPLPSRLWSAPGISSSESTKSTAPVRMAADGIPKNSDEASSCAMTVPPRCLMAVTPIEPSWPVPVRTTAMARLPYEAATDSNSRSADGRTKLTSSVCVRLTLPSRLMSM